MRLTKSAVALVLLAAACSHATTSRRGADGWTPLFDGKTFAGWRGIGMATVPSGHWKIVDGMIEKVSSKTLRTADGKALPGGDIMTDATYGDFELQWEWKATPGANSGVKYNVSEAMSAGPSGDGRAALGFEYQMIDDDRHPDGKLIRHKTGDLYDLISSNEKKHVQPIGEWNVSRVVFRGMHGEHWLNGEKVVEYDLGTPAMNAALAASKYKSIAGFGDRRRGHIVLQDHGDEMYFRHIRIRELGPTSASR